ncbi:unnamed protein product [marine sediment metagenome]|uniref:Uncharacterized protein n=1 Tax=marine sediment metagenome TaxID=412755 RepID=X0RKQ0_9ZZZZ
MRFLEGEDQVDINRFKRIFDRARMAALEIAQKAGITFYEITELRFFTDEEEENSKESALWSWDDASKTSKIAMRRTADPEALTHEIGHSLYHPSPLHDRNNEDSKYGDKFCNAFRYVLHPSKSKGWMQCDGGQYDAHKLVKKCPDLESFSKYFVELCNKKRQVGSKKRILELEGI